MIINTSGAIAATATVAIMHSNRANLPHNTLLDTILSILFACILLVLVGLIIFTDEEFKKIEDNKKDEK